jgi:hypothetical protein
VSGLFLTNAARFLNNPALFILVFFFFTMDLCARRTDGRQWARVQNFSGAKTSQRNLE